MSIEKDNTEERKSAARIMKALRSDATREDECDFTERYPGEKL